MEKLPIAEPGEEIRGTIEMSAEKLIHFTREDQQARRQMLDWLRIEHGIEKPGQKLEDFASLDAESFCSEVKKRKPKGSGRLTPASLAELKRAFDDAATPIRERRAEALTLERKVSDLVNQAYNLTPEEIDLMWRTAPPRMPLPAPASISAGTT